MDYLTWQNGNVHAVTPGAGHSLVSRLAARLAAAIAAPYLPIADAMGAAGFPRAAFHGEGKNDG